MSGKSFRRHVAALLEARLSVACTAGNEMQRPALPSSRHSAAVANRLGVQLKQDDELMCLPVSVGIHTVAALGSDWEALLPCYVYD